MTTNDQAETWYLAQLKPNSARIARENLARQGLQTFLPMEMATRQRNGRFVEALQPLFPGYIFVAFDAERGLWRTVNSTRGVTKLVSFGNAPAAVPQEIIDGLLNASDAEGQIVLASAFEAGDQVTFRSGPFAEFVAEIQDVEADQRVWILMDIMGRQTRMRVNSERLRVV